MNDLRMELKICEGCGALWLRAGAPYVGTSACRPGVYCKHCVRVLAAFPAARGPKKNSRIRVRVRNRTGVTVAVAAKISMAGGAR